MDMKNIFFHLIILAPAFLMTNCTNTKPAASSVDNGRGSEALYQNEWKLTEAQGQAVSELSKANLLFTPGQVNKVVGSTGCNRFTGSFELSNSNSIKFTPLAVTRMACLDENAGAIETKFLEALSKATAWNILNDELLLKNGNITVAKLKAYNAPEKDEAKLNGTWELNYISGARIAFDGLFPGKKPTLIFNLPDREASGNGGCNSYSSAVKINGNKISFGDAIATMMACEGNGEQAYFKALKTVTSYSVSSDNSTLTLIMGDIAVMRFTKK